jgi:hypothetical protein
MGDGAFMRKCAGTAIQTQKSIEQMCKICTNTLRVVRNDYGNIISQNLKPSVPIVHTALFGAHDAFSSKITKDSDIDPNSANKLLGNKALKFLLGDLFVRLAKAQKSDAYELAMRGIRYFDARITYANNAWYTMHSFLSQQVSEVLTDLLRFLEEHPGEFIVFDAQHLYPQPLTMQDFLAFAHSVKRNGKSILDYVHYNSHVVPISKLTYKDVVPSPATDAGVLLIFDTTDYNPLYYTQTEAVLENVWADADTYKDLLASIRHTYAHISEQDMAGIRINQGQMTVVMSFTGIFRLLKNHSLLEMAQKSNPQLIAEEDFKNWFTKMPVLWVDNADDNTNGFNDYVIGFINQYNRNL